jgi:hypothetical protein
VLSQLRPMRGSDLAYSLSTAGRVAARGSRVRRLHGGPRAGRSSGRLDMPVYVDSSLSPFTASNWPTGSFHEACARAWLVRGRGCPVHAREV